MFWFFQGSGGESQFRISCNNLSPGRRPQHLEIAIATSRYHRRFDLSIPLPISCRISNARSGMELVRCCQQNIPNASWTASPDALSSSGNGNQYPVRDNYSTFAYSCLGQDHKQL